MSDTVTAAWITVGGMVVVTVTGFLIQRSVIRMTRRHDDLVTTVAKTFGLLDGVYRAVEKYVKLYDSTPDAKKAKRKQCAIDAIKRFNRYFRPQRILLPRTLARDVYEFRVKLKEITDEYSDCLKRRTTDEDIDYGQVHTELKNRLKNEIPQLFEGLESSLRKSVGSVEVSWWNRLWAHKLHRLL